jgi:autotransporter-associated beta strand protein
VGVSSNLGDSGGALTVNGGTLDLHGNSLTVGSLSGSPGGTITDNSDGSGTTTLTVAEAADTWFGGTIEDGQSGQDRQTLALVMDGAGTLVLTGANSFTGGAQIDERGTLQVGDGTTDGSLAGNVAVESGGTLVFDVAAVGQYMGQISGDGAVTVDGYGTVLLNAEQNTYSGGTAVESGILEALTPAALPGYDTPNSSTAVAAGAGCGERRATHGILRRWRGEGVAVRLAA